MAFADLRPSASQRAGACILALALGACSDNDHDHEIPEPEILSSRNGVLQVTLTQAPARVTVAGRSFTSNVFNGQYIPPVLKLGRGDRLELEFVNRIAAAEVQIDAPMESNLHYHGMVVPPTAPGDDVFLHIAPGADYAYRWQVPPDHSQGPHWYHPHAHGLVEPQILSGMSGMLMIAGMITQHYPAFDGLVERHLVLKDIQLPGASDDDPHTKTINGVLGGTLTLRPGEMQVWNLGNLGADAYFDLAVDGAELWELNRDGNMLLAPKRVDNVFLPPGSRSTVVVVASTVPGGYAVRTREVDTGPQGDPNPEVRLATLVVGGTAIDSAALQARLLQPAGQPDTIHPTVAEIAALPITRQRTMVFSETDDGNTFFINGQSYEESRDDVTVNLGDVEEWTILNVTGERHVFHIHQLDFLVQSINNQDIDETGLRDVIDLPYMQNGVPGMVKVIIPFTNPIMVGRFVFHCHIVGHEDAGMMANLVVLPAGQTAALAPGRMRTVRAPPRNDLASLLRRWTGGKTASDIPPWADSICRDQTVVRAGAAPLGRGEPYVGASVLR
jgi:suppressor of ftsI